MAVVEILAVGLQMCCCCTSQWPEADNHIHRVPGTPYIALIKLILSKLATDKTLRCTIVTVSTSAPLLYISGWEKPDQLILSTAGHMTLRSFVSEMCYFFWPICLWPNDHQPLLGAG